MGKKMLGYDTITKNDKFRKMKKISAQARSRRININN